MLPMSKLPMALTLLISGVLLCWVHATPDAAKKEKPKIREKTRFVLPSPAGSGRGAAPLYGFPDPRGILLELRERTGSCEASAFRSKSPSFILWDDGNVVS